MGKTIRLSLPLVVTALLFAVVACSKFRPQRELKWHLVLEVAPSSSSLESAVTQTTKVLERRLDLIGINDFKVRVQEPAAKGRIEVSLPTQPDAERVKKYLISSGTLELAHVRSPPSPAPVTTYPTKEAATLDIGAQAANLRVLPYALEDLPTDSAQAARWAVVITPSIVEGFDLRNASAIPSGGNNTDYSIAFTLRAAGAQRLSAWTSQHINEYMCVILNDEIKSIAFVKSVIYDSGQIEGRFTKQFAEDLARVLNSGGLPAQVRLVEERTN
jgi:preprotein translocase subunit SecD